MGTSLPTGVSGATFKTEIIGKNLLYFSDYFCFVYLSFFLLKQKCFTNFKANKLKSTQ